jgi:hypothetical protein
VSVCVCVCVRVCSVVLCCVSCAYVFVWVDKKEKKKRCVKKKKEDLLLNIAPVPAFARIVPVIKYVKLVPAMVLSAELNQTIHRYISRFSLVQFVPEIKDHLLDIRLGC